MMAPLSSGIRSGQRRMMWLCAFVAGSEPDQSQPLDIISPFWGNYRRNCINRFRHGRYLMDLPARIGISSI